MIRVLGALVLVAVLASACGSSEANEDTSEPQEDPSEPTVSSTVPAASLQTVAEDGKPDGFGAVLVGVFEPGSSSFGAIGEDGDGNPITPEDPWYTASLGKVVTATAVMQLVDDGLLDLDTDVAEYVDFAVSDGVTARHLLGHTSGIPNMLGHIISECGDEIHLDTARALAADASEPGSVSEYSNANYLLLGLLIEAVTGEDPGDYMRDEITEPLGMESSYWFESQEGPLPYSKRHLDASTGVPAGCDRIETTVGTDGAMISSHADFDAFYRALFGGELVTDDSLAQMLEMNTEQFGYRYGLGILEMVDQARPEDVLYGFGGSGFYSTAAFHDPVKQRTVVVVTTATNQVDLVWEAIDWANANQPE